MIYVYDYKIRKWVFYVVDVNKYKNYFVVMSEGRVKLGWYIIKFFKMVFEEFFKIVFFIV